MVDSSIINMSNFKAVTNAKDERQIVVMTIEEMAELTQVLTKILRQDNTMHTPKELYSELMEEFADANLMLSELQYKFDLKTEEVCDIINFKMDRWLKRNGYKESGEELRELPE